MKSHTTLNGLLRHQNSSRYLILFEAFDDCSKESFSCTVANVDGLILNQSVGQIEAVYIPTATS